MGNTAEAVAAMEKVVELVPTDFASSYNLGLFRIKIGDDMNQELNKQNFTGQNEYNAALQKVFDAYKEAIPPLERAYEIDPKNPIAIELLKNVTFRLRDEPGMMEKYEKYNELFKQIQ